jgi:hypothetical protein
MKKVKIGDILIIVCTLILAGILLLLWPSGDGDLIAVVSQNGRVLHRIALSGIQEPIEIEVDGAYHNHIIAENGRIRFDDSNCPDKICVHTGWLDRAGQSAACLPNKTLIVIEGSGNLDAISN